CKRPVGPTFMESGAPSENHDDSFGATGFVRRHRLRLARWLRLARLTFPLSIDGFVSRIRCWLCSALSASFGAVASFRETCPGLDRRGWFRFGNRALASFRESAWGGWGSPAGEPQE